MILVKIYIKRLWRLTEEEVDQRGGGRSEQLFGSKRANYSGSEKCVEDKREWNRTQALPGSLGTNNFNFPEVPKY